MWSYWEKEQILSADLVVVGAGFTGLSAALHYLENHSNRKVIVLDRSPFSMGASTRNAGFACIGSPTELLMNLENYTEDEVFTLVGKRYRGLCTILNRFGTRAIGACNAPSFELIVQSQEEVLHKLDYLNRSLSNHLPSSPFEIVSKNQHPIPDAISDFPHSIRLIFEYPLNPGMLYQSLWRETAQAGALIWGGLTFLDYESRSSFIDLYFQDAENRPGKIRTKDLLICSNGFTKQFLKAQTNIEPGRGMILLSKPFEKRPFEGMYHLERGNVYFREVDNRLLFGGGRHWFVDEENTDEFGLNARLEKELIALSQRVFPGLAIEWEDKWSGIMGFSNQFKPTVKWIDENTLLGAGMNGMGLALGFSFGKELAITLDRKKC